MSWTYDASLLDPDTAVGRRYIVRLSLGDTDTTDQQLADEEIDYYLDAADDTIRTATISALKGLIAKYSRQADLWVGHTRIQASQRARNYRLLLDELQAVSASNFIVQMLVSGQSKSEKLDLNTDTDAVQPAFSVGMDDIDGADEGTYINASFSTANFLGLGETFQVSLQSGKRTKNYQVAITEPYFLDRPITAGFDVFKRSLRYESYSNVAGYRQDSTGLGLVFGVPVGRFSRVFLNYGYSVIDIRDCTPATGSEDPEDPTLPRPPTIGDPLFLGNFKESKVSPTFVYNTVDNPWQPRAGDQADVLGAGGLQPEPLPQKARDNRPRRRAPPSSRDARSGAVRGRCHARRARRPADRTGWIPFRVPRRPRRRAGRRLRRRAAA